MSAVTTGQGRSRWHRRRRQARYTQSAPSGEVAVVPELLTEVASPTWAYLALLGLLVADAFVPD